MAMPGRRSLLHSIPYTQRRYTDTLGKKIVGRKVPEQGLSGGKDRFPGGSNPTANGGHVACSRNLAFQEGGIAEAWGLDNHK